MDPKSLQDCTRRSVPYFGGGFSRKSPIRYSLVSIDGICASMNAFLSVLHAAQPSVCAFFPTERTVFLNTFHMCAIVH